MVCHHDIAEMEVAIVADGYCPICSAAKLRIAMNALKTIDDIAVSHRRGAMGEAQKVARSVLNGQLSIEEKG